MLDGERLVWAVALAALTSALGVTLIIARARRYEPHSHDVDLFANVMALGLLVVVLVAVAFVAGYAALERRSDYIVIAVSVLGIGIVLFNDATRRSRTAAPVELVERIASDAAEERLTTRQVKNVEPIDAKDRTNADRTTSKFDCVFTNATPDADPLVLAAAARAEACVNKDRDAAHPLGAAPGQKAERETEGRAPYPPGLPVGRLPRS